MTGQALLLAPSRGLGGGIERYAETLEWALAEQNVACRRVDLSRPGPAAHARALAEASRHLRSSVTPTRLVLAHRCLLPIAVLLARTHRVRGISVVCHGSDVWGTRRQLRWFIEQRLMRTSSVRVVAVSSFTAGALSACSQATILPPGLARDWFDTLVEASTVQRAAEPGIRLVTAFRLADWRDKGLPQILGAVAALGRSDVHVIVCGSGEPSADLLRLVGSHQRCRMRSGLTDVELARHLAAADLFVLATRTRFGRQPSGEGFGLVLLEAQVAGTPVVGPAYGGSHDAYVDMVTGLTPADESVPALANALGQLLRDPCQLAQMGKRASEWARECYAPDLYAARAVARLL